MKKRVTIKDKFINFIDINDEYIIEFDNNFNDKNRNNIDILNNPIENFKSDINFHKPLNNLNEINIVKFQNNFKNSSKIEIKNLNTNQVIKKLKKDNKKQILKDLFKSNEKLRIVNNRNDISNDDKNNKSYNLYNNVNNSLFYKININKYKKNKKKQKKKINYKAIKNSQNWYKKCIEIKSLKDDIFNKEKIKKENLEYIECTFKPITNKTYNYQINEKFEDRQKNWIKSQNIKEVKKLKYTKEKELNNCTFKPNTNISQKETSIKSFFKRREIWLNYLDIKKKIHCTNIKSNIKNKKKKILKTPNYINQEKNDIKEINNLINSIYK